jgi:hypothetical protein
MHFLSMQVLNTLLNIHKIVMDTPLLDEGRLIYENELI